ELDHLGDVAARDALGHHDDQLDPVLDRLEYGVLGEGRGDGDDRAVDRGAVVLDRLLDGVEDGHTVNVATLATGGDPADDLGAVVEALPRQVDRLAPGDPLDDEGEVLAQQDAHGLTPLHAPLSGRSLPGPFRRPPRRPPTSRWSDP